MGALTVRRHLRLTMGCESSTPAAAPGGPADEKYDKEKGYGDTSGMSEEDKSRLKAGPGVNADGGLDGVKSWDEIRAEAEKIFHRVDVDGSRELDKEEFLAIASNNSSRNAKKNDKIQAKKDAAATKLMQVAPAPASRISQIGQPQSQPHWLCRSATSTRMGPSPSMSGPACSKIATRTVAPRSRGR